jgi:hypothetical protein
MNKLVLTIVGLLIAFSASANTNCEIKTVFHVTKSVENFRTDVEAILQEKGFNVVRDGFLYIDENVLPQELQIRPELKVPGTLFGVFRTAWGYDMYNGCYWEDYQKYNCQTDLSIFRADKAGNLVLVSKLKTPVFTKNPAKTRQTVIEMARQSLPVCRH